jgi:hypothetical protein
MCMSASGSVTSWSSISVPNTNSVYFPPPKRALTGGGGYFKVSNASLRSYSSGNGGSTWSLIGYFYGATMAFQRGQASVFPGGGALSQYINYWPTPGTSGVVQTNISAGSISPAANANLWASYRNASSNIVYTSPNGTTWTSRTSPVTQLNSVSAGTNKYILGFSPGYSTFVYTADGATWYSGTLPTSDSWNAATSDGTSVMLFSSSSLQAYKITIT